MGTIYGYCRISTNKQNIERQVRNISATYPTAVIVKEVYTGKTIERPAFDRLIKKIRGGDTIIFDSVSRMSRNAEEGFKLYEQLFREEVNLIFLKEPYINTETYKKAINNSVPLTGTKVDLILQGVNSYLMELAREQIIIAFEQSEKEVTDLRQRTREGLITAKLMGHQVGRKEGDVYVSKKSVKYKGVIKKHSKDFSGTLNDVELMQLTGLSRNTFYKYKRELFTDPSD